MKYKLVIFDFDGTLADSLPWFMSITNQVADTYRFKRIEEHEIETLRGYGAAKVIKHLGIPFWKLPFIARHLRQLTAQNVASIPLFAGVDELLHTLANKGVLLAVVSSNSEANIRSVFGPQMAALVAYYECSVSVFGKSSRFRKILAKSGIAPREAICIGDELRDFEAARKVGIPFGAVAWGYTTAEAFHAHAPTAVFRSIDDIKTAIL